jgi:hypothetical protein
MAIDPNYYNILAKIESGNRPNIKAPTSSASGLYQFIKSTAIQFGLPWGNDPTKAFGGAIVSIDQQNEAIAKFTQGNASFLEKAGIAINNATLYAAHFLGAGTAKTILGADPNAKVSSIVSPGVITANPFLKNMTVQGFYDWLSKKTGATVNSSSPLPKGPKS